MGDLQNMFFWKVLTFSPMTGEISSSVKLSFGDKYPKQREKLPFVFKEMLTIVKEWNPLPRKKLIIISSVVLRKRILSEHIFFAMLDLEQRASLSSMFIQRYL